MSGLIWAILMDVFFLWRSICALQDQSFSMQKVHRFMKILFPRGIGRRPGKSRQKIGECQEIWHGLIHLKAVPPPLFRALEKTAIEFLPG